MGRYFTLESELHCAPKQSRHASGAASYRDSIVLPPSGLQFSSSGFLKSSAECTPGGLYNV